MRLTRYISSVASVVQMATWIAQVDGLMTSRPTIAISTLVITMKNAP